MGNFFSVSWSWANATAQLQVQKLLVSIMCPRKLQGISVVVKTQSGPACWPCALSRPPQFWSAGYKVGRTSLWKERETWFNCRPVAEPVQDIRLASCCFVYLLSQKLIRKKKEKEVIALLQEEPWKMRQKPGLWGRVWCLRFFISPAGLKALFSWPLLLRPTFCLCLLCILPLSAAGESMPQLFAWEEGCVPVHLVRL